ncbi:hypothetical protein [Demequina globuliformis]|uniref:hypothetical protein n=1 Tax=Demequina globuliformis TaxID=676202 RepID=UPI0007857BA3|nr:hypothetical protein [Demequina globuliformis]
MDDRVGGAADSALGTAGVLLDDVRALVPQATVPTWQQPSVGYGDSRAVISLTGLVALPVHVAWAQTSGIALRISRLRGWATMLFATASALIEVSESVTDSVDPDLLRRALSSPADVRTHPWFWKGWDPVTRGPRTVPEGPGWYDSWQVPVVEAAGAGLGRILPLLRQQIVDGPPVWMCGEGSPRERATLRDGDGVSIAQFSRAEDAAYCVAARRAVAGCGGLVEAVTALVDGGSTAPIAREDYLRVVNAARPWMPPSASIPTS